MIEPYPNFKFIFRETGDSFYLRKVDSLHLNVRLNHSFYKNVKKSTSFVLNCKQNIFF